MITLAAIPLACWLAVLIATPRRPRVGNEIEELVYVRLLGRQEQLRLLAIVATAAALFMFVLALPAHGVRDAGYILSGRYYCTPAEADTQMCYSLQPDGSWLQTG